MGFFKNLKEGLFKSSKNITEGLSDIFIKTKANDILLHEIEEFMIRADFGVSVSQKFKSLLASQKFSEDELNAMRELLRRGYWLKWNDEIKRPILFRISAI